MSMGLLDLLGCFVFVVIGGGLQHVGHLSDEMVLIDASGELIDEDSLPKLDIGDAHEIGVTDSEVQASGDTIQLIIDHDHVRTAGSSEDHIADSQVHAEMDVVGDDAMRRAIPPRNTSVPRIELSVALIPRNLTNASTQESDTSLSIMPALLEAMHRNVAAVKRTSLVLVQLVDKKLWTEMRSSANWLVVALAMVAIGGLCVFMLFAFRRDHHRSSRSHTITRSSLVDQSLKLNATSQVLSMLPQDRLTAGGYLVDDAVFFNGEQRLWPSGNRVFVGLCGNVAGNGQVQGYISVMFEGNPGIVEVMPFELARFEQHLKRNEPLRLPIVGVPVVRGADWSWEDQDSGLGSIGMTINDGRNGWIEVQWLAGPKDWYRIGADDRYDLFVSCKPSKAMQLPPVASTSVLSGSPGNEVLASKSTRALAPRPALGATMTQNRDL